MDSSQNKYNTAQQIDENRQAELADEDIQQEPSNVPQNEGGIQAQAASTDVTPDQNENDGGVEETPQ